MIIKEHGLLNIADIDKCILYYQSEVVRLHSAKKFELAHYANGKLSAFREIKGMLVSSMPLCEKIAYESKKITKSNLRHDYYNVPSFPSNPIHKEIQTFLNSDIKIDK